CWLVNTGWTGGGYGRGERISIRHTRALVSVALDGSLAEGRFRIDPHFGLSVPVSVPGVPDDVLDPRATWADKAAYDRAAADLVRRFSDNFATFSANVDQSVHAAALRAA
ncbi:MAG TPA: phosphoenolpyruvate carboxykinase (ATP), partial [Acidisphaera sp.]|nr:phosphoenolpyruvate carboxykinase (ATP) [Acidisphaera sp.]